MLTVPSFCSLGSSSAAVLVFGLPIVLEARPTAMTSREKFVRHRKNSRLRESVSFVEAVLRAPGCLSHGRIGYHVGRRAGSAIAVDDISANRYVFRAINFDDALVAERRTKVCELVVAIRASSHHHLWWKEPEIIWTQLLLEVNWSVAPGRTNIHTLSPRRFEHTLSPRRFEPHQSQGRSPLRLHQLHFLTQIDLVRQ